MLIFAYCIPIIACLILRFVYDYSGEWTHYLATFLSGEAAVGILHWLFYSSRVSATEYLGSIVRSVEHEDEWIELKKEKVTKYDSNGKAYEVTEIREIRHPEIYRFFTSLGNEIITDSYFYNHVCRRWTEPLQYRSWSGKHIKYGTRYGQYKRFADESINGFADHDKYVTLSEENVYTNKIINSTSIFNFEKITKEDVKTYGLYDWPKQDSHYDVPCILSRKFKIPDNIDALYRRFNALEAPKKQLRLFILIFDADQGIAVAEKQKSYWKGGNKNEIVICLGVNNDKIVKWVFTFSWAKENIVEVEINQWFLEHPHLDFEAFLAWFTFQHRKWKRREFKEFDYIRVSLKLWHYIAIMIGGIAAAAIAIYICLKN